MINENLKEKIMILYPKLYLQNVTKITYEILKENNIKGVLLDVDNTLIDYDKKLLDGVESWIKQLKEKEIKFCILSNTNQKEKVDNVAKKLDIPYIFFAKKPLKTGFKKAQKKLGLSHQEIAVVGDQIFTDVIGANRCKMFSILVKPINEKDIFITKIKRPIEESIINKYLKTKEEK